MQNFAFTWYNWAVFLGLLLSAGIAVYIWLDSEQKGRGEQAMLPRILSALAVALALPSLFFRVTQWPAIQTLQMISEGAEGVSGLLGGVAGSFLGDTAGDALGAAAGGALDSAARAALGLPDTNFQLWAIVGIAGLLLAIAALLVYMSKSSVPVVSEMPLPTFAPPPTMPMPPAPVAPTAEPAMRAPDPTKLVSPEPETKAWLVVRNGKMSGRQFGLGTRSANIIGRDPNKADIVVDEGTVSREHARLKFDNGQFVIYDMASTGGTYVNGNSVQRQLLYDNDRIRLGNIEFVYKKV